MSDIVERYLETWNADDSKRADLLAAHWSPQVIYIDPLVEATGHAAVSDVIERVHAEFPGFLFSALGAVDAHHQQLRFRWGLGPVGAEPVVIGFDVVVLDEGGRIKDVRGFLDQVPA